MVSRPDFFINKTNQSWKLKFFIFPIAVVGVIIVILRIAGNELVFMQQFFPFVSLVTIVLFAFGCASIQCPNCRLSILWHAASMIRHDSWAFWLLSFNKCPRCKFKPKDPQDIIPDS